MSPEAKPEDCFAVVICTRNRPGILQRTLDALDAQEDRDFDVVVVDGSDAADPALARRATKGARMQVVGQERRGLSHARNLGWQAAQATWVAYLDDDVVPEPGWAAELRRALRSHSDVDFVSGHVGAASVPTDDYLLVTTHEVTQERRLAGRWTRPWDIGFTLCMAVRRTWLERLGGFDERLGPGVKAFPSAEDMDFNYRFLLAGGSAYVTPRVRANHEQWRTTAELGPHFRGYMAGWSGFSMKHLRLGNVTGGLWLWSLGLRDLARMALSSARRRSPLRARAAAYKLAGLLTGTARGLARRW